MSRLRANHEEMTFSTNAGVLVRSLRGEPGHTMDLGEASKESAWSKKLGPSALNKKTQVDFTRT